MGVDADEATELVTWNIFKTHRGYSFAGRDFAWLAGALIAAKQPTVGRGDWATEPNQAQLRAAALAAMQNSVGSAHDSLPEVTAFATVIGFPNADALALLRHDILQDGTGYRFKGKFYADLAGALKATRL